MEMKLEFYQTQIVEEIAKDLEADILSILPHKRDILTQRNLIWMLTLSIRKLLKERWNTLYTQIMMAIVSAFEQKSFP